MGPIMFIKHRFVTKHIWLSDNVNDSGSIKTWDESICEVCGPPQVMFSPMSICWLGWFVSRITQKACEQTPRNLDGGCVSVQIIPHNFWCGCVYKDGSGTCKRDRGHLIVRFLRECGPWWKNLVYLGAGICEWVQLDADPHKNQKLN